MTVDPVGVVGLGNMGSLLAGNLVARGLEVLAHDVAGPARAPAGATFLDDVGELARRAGTVVLSLPDGQASEAVARALLVDGRRVTHVVDTSTIGVRAAQTVDSLLAAAGVPYVDAPVSGGTEGARNRTLVVMYAGGDDACATVEPVLLALTDRHRRVGDRAGMAQAMKLVNNFLSATALVATSEALAFGRSAGLDLETMLDVLNASSGRNGATEEKFPAHVLTGRYASGFSNALMAKDVALYLREAADHDTPVLVAPTTAAVWSGFAEAEPGIDFTRIYPFVADG